MKGDDGVMAPVEVPRGVEIETWKGLWSLSTTRFDVPLPKDRNLWVHSLEVKPVAGGHPKFSLFRPNVVLGTMKIDFGWEFIMGTASPRQKGFVPRTPFLWGPSPR